MRQQLSSDAHDLAVDREVRAGLLHGLVSDPKQARAARDLHVHHGEAANPSDENDLRQLLHIGLAVVQFRTTDGDRPSIEDFRMEVRVREWHAIGDEQEVGLLQER
jgi:hypothetical protein